MHQILKKSSVNEMKLAQMELPPVTGSKQMRIGDKDGLWIRKSSAQSYLETVNKKLKDQTEKMVDDMTNYFNDDVVKVCNEIMADYRAHIQKLKDKGAFNLAGLDVTKLIAAVPSISETIDINKITKTRNEYVRSKTVQKTGFWNGIKAFFGADSAYETVSVYENVEYVFMLDLFTTQRAKMVNAYSQWTLDEARKLGDQLDTLKKDVASRMDKLDSFIKKLFDEYTAKLGDTTALEKEANKWLEQSDWLEKFLKSVNDLLDVEPAGKKG